MKTQTLMTVSFLTLMAVTVPAMADTNVLCSVRSNYKNANVSATYKPGVDVKGKPVMGADVAPAPVGVPKSMTIPLTMDIAQRFNEVLPTGSKLESQVGLVEVLQDGRVMINGKDMTGPSDTMCSTVAKQKELALKTKDAPKVVHHKKKTAPKHKAASMEPKMEAAPAPEVATEPVAPAPAASPQVLEATPPAAAPKAPTPAAPVPQPVPMATPAAPAPTPAPTPGAGVPTPPPSGAIVSPTESGNVPRAPLDPLTGAPNPAPQPPAPNPAPANNNGTLSGGAQ